MKKKICYFVIMLLFVPLAMLLSACGNIEFKIKFIVDGREYAVVSTAGNETISMPENPTKTDYEFDGWYWDNNVWQEPFTANSLLKQPLNSDMKVYAKWIQNGQSQNSSTYASFSDFEFVEDETYSRKVDNNISTLNFSNIVQVNSQSTWTLCTDIYATKTIPSKIGTLSIGNNTYYILVTARNNDVKLYTLHIRRLPLYYVTYKNSIGTTLKTIQVQEEDYVNAINLDDLIGYTFDSWQYDFTQPIMSTTTIIAKYNPNQYKITYHSNFGDQQTIQETVYYDQYITLKAKNTFARKGYDFTNWNTKSDNLGNSYNVVSIKYNFTENIDLYAIWQIVNYSVTYKLNNGTNNANNITTYNVEMNNIPLYNAQKNYYDFVSWTTNGQVITEINTQLCENLVLTANFTPTVYTITYVLNGGTNSDDNPKTYTIETPTITFIPAVFQNETVSRWYSEATFDNRIISIPNGSYGNKTIYARAGYDEYDTLTIINNMVTGLNYSFINEFKLEIKEINVPEGITSINEYAFKNKSNLTSVIIPSSVTSLSAGMFSGCNSLASLTLPFVGDSIKQSTDTYQYPLGYVFGTSSYTDGVAIIQYYYGSSISSATNTTFYIPDSLKNVTITGGNINYGAFYNCSGLININVPDNITNICEDAFFHCSSLTNIEIPNSVTSIGSYAFSGCSSLTNIAIPDSVTSIGSSAFYACGGLTSITLGNSITSIGIDAFSYCRSLTNVAIPNNVTSIGSYAFSYCSSLTNIEIPNSVTSIGDGAFSSCSGLTNITIPNSVTSIGYRAFNKCGLTSVNFKNPNGWNVKHYYNGSARTLNNTNLSNLGTAATYLKSTYCDYNWTRYAKQNYY